MEHVQRSTTLSGAAQLDTAQRIWRHRLLISLLIGGAITVLLTLSEITLVLLFNPWHILGNALSRFSTLLMLPLSMPVSLTVPLSELVVTSAAAFLLTMPIALIRYLQTVHRAQQVYHQLYIPLTMVANAHKTDEFSQASEYPQAYPLTSALARQDEQISILDHIQQQNTHQLILGQPGAGKTIALCVYQYILSQPILSLAFSRRRIPIYIPMKNYNFFLKKHIPLLEQETFHQDPQPLMLLHYLQDCDLPAIHYLRPYLQKLFERGRLLLLCDGLDEVDPVYLSLISKELAYLMQEEQNRLIVTCREIDYNRQGDFAQLVDEGQAVSAVISSLQPEQIHEFIELYIQKQDKQWKHTAGQIWQLIDRTRLCNHCTNPMMLFTLLGTIDRIGIERGKQIDTRGRLLREYVKQVINREGRQAQWRRSAPAEQDVVRFLSKIAYVASWTDDRNAIQLPLSAPQSATDRPMSGKMDYQEFADALRIWLDENSPRGPYLADKDGAIAILSDDFAQLLAFTVSTALIDMSPRGVLSFRHKLIADYFVAEYFFTLAQQTSLLALLPELCEHGNCWSELIAIWAGLLDNPLELAEQFGTFGLQHSASLLQAIVFGLVCVGVLWTPPQADVQEAVILPANLEKAISTAICKETACEELAHMFTLCAQEGGQEIYRSLFPLMMVEGTDEFLPLLDQTIVLDLLFKHLEEVADTIAYEAQVKRLTRVLGRFGGAVVRQAVQLSIPTADRSTRLRAAAINILGGTNDARAVEPLLARLRDADTFIVERATNALMRLGPSLTLIHVLRRLEYQAANRVSGPLMARVRYASLAILGHFLDEQDEQRRISLMQYQQIIEHIVPVLTSHHQTEPCTQLSRQILVREGRNITGVATHDHRWQKVIEALIEYIPSQSDIAGPNVIMVLQEIGAPATPYLIDLLEHTSEVVRARVASILQVARDLQALPAIVQLINDSSLVVQQQIAATLHTYAPESIAELLNLIIDGLSAGAAERSAQILVSIGIAAVEPVIEALAKTTPERTRLLVQMLEIVHDLRAIPALIALLQTSQLEPLLAVAIVRALGQFQDSQVVPALLAMLFSPETLVYEQAITVLSQLSNIALPHLIESLNVKQEPVVIQRIKRAILGITPFPAEKLIWLLEESTEVQMEHIMDILVQQGTEATVVIIRHLLYPEQRVRQAIQQALEQVPGAIAVPALLDALSQQELREIACTFLLKYPDAAISPLVSLLGDPKLGEIAATLLPQFDLLTLRPLISGLDDQRPMARQFARHIMVCLVDQHADKQTILRDIVHLFNPPPPVHAYEELLDLLTQELADLSLSALLAGLEDAHLIESVADAFVRLVRKPEKQRAVLDSLITAIFKDERRRGAEIALTRIGAVAVVRVGELITDQNELVVKSAKQILREIGVPALRFIWTAHSDCNNTARREAALEVFRSMRTEVIKDELVALLMSEQHDDIAMAVVLLLERISEEAKQRYEERVLVPELLEYMQTHTVESLNLRIIALLLLLGEQAIIDHLIQALEDYPQPRKQLMYMLLLLGNEAQRLLLQVFNDTDTAVELRFELATVLGMVSAPQEIIGYACNISRYGLLANHTGTKLPEQHAIALRSLGGLLASGYWNAQKLVEMRDASKSGDPARELFNILLGGRYEPHIAKLRSDLEVQRDTFKNEVLALTGRIVAEQRRAQMLENDLAKLQQEHGFRGDELHQLSRERDAFRAKIDQLIKEKATLQAGLDQVTKDKASLVAQTERMRKEYKELQQKQANVT
jgi:HEAT repeat protein